MSNWPSPHLSDVSSAFQDRGDISVWMLHEPAGELHAGNKRYKLERNLDQAVAQGLRGIVSFGGAWSNHVVALAHAAKHRGLQCTCIIRGEPSYLTNPSLSDAQQQGMQFEFVDRAEYRLRNHNDWLNRLRSRFPDHLILPEGGSNLQAVQGCAAMLDSLSRDFLQTVDIVGCPVGTGATLTGLRLALTEKQAARGYMAVRDPGTSARMQKWWTAASSRDDVDLTLVDASGPGYSRLDVFHYLWINDWLSSTGILLDPVYTVKMVTGMSTDIQRGVFPADARILLVHTGGLQGWRGWQEGKRCADKSHYLSASSIAAVSTSMVQGEPC